MRSRLRTQVEGLLDMAGDAYLGTTAAQTLADIRTRLDEPLRVAIAGKVKAGKSTLLNALVGEELAPTDAGECTKVVTWYRHGHTHRVELFYRDGSVRQAPFSRVDGKLSIDLGGAQPHELDRIEVTWATDQLSALTLIDTPGLGSLSADVGERSRSFLALDEEAPPSEADAVIYLMRHMHQADLDFLESFHDDDLASASPINAIAVLSRADEIGACRTDALVAAQRVSNRLAADPRIRRLVQTVVPVAGLLAEASMTLTETQYRALATIAALPRDDADAMILTADRFLAPHAAALTVDERGDLVDTLGLFGVRSAISLIRLGSADDAGTLAVKLRERSGISRLRALLLSLFTERRDVLKARVALAALDDLVRRTPPVDAPRLVAEIERITAGAHELVEVEVLQTLRSGRVRLSDDEIVELDRLYGHIGGTPTERLGADGPEARAAAIAAIDRWRRRGESPLAPLDTTVAAQAIVRSYEGLLAEL